MNIDLLEQFGQNYPEEFDGILDCITFPTTAVFNRRGSVLAVGCNDGRIFIWDFLTRGIAKIISAHVGSVTSLSWSRNGKFLASSSMDCYASVWDVLSSECIIRWHFNVAVFSVQFGPRNHNILLIRPLKQPSILVQYSLGPDGKVQSKTHARIPHDDESEFDVISSFDRRGEYVYSGNSKGRIQVVQLEPGTINLNVVTSFRVSNTAIKQIEFAPRKKNIFLVNSADRIIRVYNTSSVLSVSQASVNASSNQSMTRGRKVNLANNPALSDARDPEPVQKLQDLVNRTTWKKCCFSGMAESDYICAGSSRQHSIYIWDRSTGSLVKILHGTKGEILNDVIWHPIRPVIASIANGVVSIWSQAQVENWSAFAPDFNELEENIEYEEKESEFDEDDEDNTPSKQDCDNNNDEEVLVDVETPNTIEEFLSSDEEEEDRDALVYFPITVDIDDVDMDNADDPLFEDNLTPPAVHKETKSKSKEKSNDDAPKPLQVQNRNVYTIEM